MPSLSPETPRHALRVQIPIWLVACALATLTACGAGVTEPNPGSGNATPTPSPIPTPASVDAGTTSTVWYTGTPIKPAVTAGTWRAGGPNPNQSSFTLVKETAHFTFYSDETISTADLDQAADFLENTVWQNLFNTNQFMPEPFHNKADKIKHAIHIHSGWGLTGGAWVDNQGALHLGMWIAPPALKDH